MADAQHARGEGHRRESGWPTNREVRTPPALLCASTLAYRGRRASGCTGVCVVGGCSTLHVAHGPCAMVWKAWFRGETPAPAQPSPGWHPTSPSPGFSATNMENTAFLQGWLGAHHTRKLQSPHVRAEVSLRRAAPEQGSSRGNRAGQSSRRSQRVTSHPCRSNHRHTLSLLPTVSGRTCSVPPRRSPSWTPSLSTSALFSALLRRQSGKHLYQFPPSPSL